jgi:hypothetical protein
MKNATSMLRDNRVRVAAVVVLLAVAVIGVLRYTNGSEAQAQTTSSTVSAAAVSTPGSTGSTTYACVGGCCGGGAASTPVEGAAQLDGSVQKVSVDLSSGSYNPNVLVLKAGIPTEITFGQSSGCTGYVQSQDLGFQADLTGGPQTVKLPGLQPGTYGFACGMNMVFGEIVVQ